jgi:flagellar basal-body rod modification protein FlgD
MTVAGINGTASAATTSTSTTSNTSATAAAASNTLNYNQFLNLLVAQLKNQDPSNPTDPTTFVSQLASFSAVEQEVNANSKLDSLLTQSAIAQAGALIGKTLTSADGSTSGQVASVQITSSGPEATLTNGKSISLGTGITVS